MNKKAYAFFLKKNRPRRHNPVVLDLNDGPYHQRVVKNKKVYDRQKHKISSRDCEWEVSDV
jgi:hypothetical protein